MKERELYTVASLELHLFFLRIMKEHAIFPAEELLLQAARLADGIVRPEIPISYHFSTKYCNTDDITHGTVTKCKILERDGASSFT